MKLKKTPGGKVWLDWAKTPEQQALHEEKMGLCEKYRGYIPRDPSEITNLDLDRWREREKRGNKPDSPLPFSRCYLTTACVGAMDLPDDCFELETLRKFRDKVLIRDPSGKKVVKEYYRIAPEIVQAVEETEGDNSQKVWRQLYNNIRKAIFLILSSDFNRAFKHYQQMTSRLKAKYLD